MVFLKVVKPHRHYSLLRHQSTSLTHLTSQRDFSNLVFPYSIFQRKFSASTQSDVVEEPTKPDWARSKINAGKKPLHVLFRSAVGIGGNHECGESSDDECVVEGEKSTGIQELKKKLRKLERDAKRLKRNFEVEESEQSPKKAETESSPSKPKSLYSLFVKDSVSEENSSSSKQVNTESSGDMKGFKGFSPEMASLVGVLHQQGYLKNANFLRSKHLNLSCFSTYYSLSFVRAAAEKFGEDHQEIAKYLSRDHLIRIALFGCPSTERRTAFAAKRLRSFYDIKEDIVCRPCKLRSSCKVVNQTVGRKIHDLHLKDVMRILTRYALEKIDIPDELKSSVEKLLSEVVNLSEEQLNPSSDSLDCSIQVT